MERIVFPVPHLCEFLTNETKARVLQTSEKDDQGSKVTSFFEETDNMFMEMQWQKKLRGENLLEFDGVRESNDQMYRHNISLNTRT